MGQHLAVRAVVFDFDGVILETEEPEYLAWREIWEGYGQDLPLETWSQCIGTRPEATSFDPFGELARRSGQALDERELRAQAQRLKAQFLGGAGPREGVVEWVREAQALGMAVAVASSSTRSWVSQHLQRLGLAGQLRVLACYDDCGAAKPDPASYLLACRQLGVAPAEALAVEDSLNGLRAAKAAGLACVVVPTKMTAHMGFAEADLVLPSLRAAGLASVVKFLAPLPQVG